MSRSLETKTEASTNLISGNNPEVIANEPLDNTKLIFSTPVFNEWRNGNLIRHVRAVLSQKTDPNTSIESNYILNFGGKEERYIEWHEDGTETIDWGKVQQDPSLFEIYRDTEESLYFLKQVIKVQQLSTSLNLSSDHRIRSELDYIINNEPSASVRDLLELASKKAGNIAISCVNTVTDRQVDDSYRRIDGLRTLGMDYVYRRVPDKDAVLFLYDCDIVPSDNRFSQETLKIYENNPEITYVYANIGYQAPGTSKELVVGSPSYVLKQSAAYEFDAWKGSPQISFRLRAIPDLQKITSMGWQGDEDRDTAYRLGLFYADMQNGVLSSYKELTLPNSLTLERLNGYSDSIGRVAQLGDESIKAHGENIKLFKILKSRILERIDKLTPEKKQEVLSDLEEARNEYSRRQKVQIRFNRLVAGRFLNSLDSGEIKIDSLGPIYNHQTILQKKGGKALASYMESNKELIASLNQDDIEYMKYLLGLGEYPEDLLNLSPFHIAMREYLGEYTDSNMFNKNEDDIIRKDTKDKESYLMPLLAEVYALGTIYYKHFNAEEINEYREAFDHRSRSKTYRKPIRR